MAKSLRQAYLDAQDELERAGISDETRLLLRKYHAVIEYHNLYEEVLPFTFGEDGNDMPPEQLPPRKRA